LRVFREICNRETPGFIVFRVSGGFSRGALHRENPEFVPGTAKGARECTKGKKRRFNGRIMEKSSGKGFHLEGKRGSYQAENSGFGEEKKFFRRGKPGMGETDPALKRRSHWGGIYTS